MKRLSFILTTLYFGLFLMACKAPIDPDLEKDQSQGKGVAWLKIEVSFENLPGAGRPEMLHYEINVVGEDSALFINSMGDTLDYLIMQFFTSDWVIKSNADADTLWYGDMYVGRRIVLDPVFQLDSAKVPYNSDDDSNTLLPGNNGDFPLPPFPSRIKLRVAFVISRMFWQIDLENPWEAAPAQEYALHFDPQTGEYTTSRHLSVIGPEMP